MPDKLHAPGQYVQLKFPDVPGETAPDIAALAKRIREFLGVRVNPASVMKAVQFFWHPDLDSEVVSDFLAKIQGKHSTLEITAREAPYIDPDS